ncbi:hypothetical protein T296_16280 [Pantoea agglomerans Eh318]|nr:hypothetical protein T296_16280 [Pantoea agglomerans Eh318]
MLWHAPFQRRKAFSPPVILKPLILRSGMLKYAPAPGFNGYAGYIRYRASGMMSAHHD